MSTTILGYRIHCDQHPADAPCPNSIDIATTGIGHAVNLTVLHHGWSYAPTKAAERAAPPHPRMPLRLQNWCPEHKDYRGDATPDVS